MLKSSSLCLYISNLGTFWLKIKQFWPFEEISIFSNGGHLGWRAWLSDINFKGNQPPKDDSGQVWFKLAWWFQRRRFLKKFTEGRRMPSDGNSSHR
jgi:hypothetical protein